MRSAHRTVRSAGQPVRLTLIARPRLTADLSSVGRDRRATTDTVIAGVQDSEVCWMGGTSQDDRRFSRMSFTSRQTTRADAGRCVDAVLAAVEATR